MLNSQYLRKFVHKGFLILNVIAAGSLVFSYLATHISPSRITLPSFFGLAYPYILVINIIFVLFWAVRLKIELLISLIAIAAGYSHFSNYMKLSVPKADKTNSFSVMSYNIRLFNYFEGSGNSEKKIIEFLKVRQPDIICLQEFYLTGSPEQKEKSLKSALGRDYFSHMKVFGSGKNRYYGIITLSKYPIIKKGEIIHPGSSSLSIFTDILMGHDTIRIFNNHLQSIRLHRMERSLINELTVSNDDKEALGEIKKISSSINKAFKVRAGQAEVLKEHIKNSPYPVIIAGDFNDTPVSYTYSKIRKGLNDAFVTSGYGAGFTYRGNYPPNRIDYILYDNSFRSVYFEIVKIRYSDHYPVIASFRKAG